MGCIQGMGYIIDDGSYAYAVVPIDGKAHLIDPHVSHPTQVNAVLFEKEFFLRKKGWMILEVPPK